MIAFLAGVRGWIADGVTGMRRGMNMRALQVRQGLGRDPGRVSSALCWSHARRKFFELVNIKGNVRKGTPMTYRAWR